GAQQEVGGGGVVVLAEEFEETGGAEAGAAHDGAGVAKGGGGGADLDDELFDGFKHGVGPAGEVVGVALLAGPQAGGAGGLGGGKEADVLGLGFARGAGGQAVDAGGGDAEEEAAVVRRIAGEDAGVEFGRIQSHGVESSTRAAGCRPDGSGAIFTCRGSRPCRRRGRPCPSCLSSGASSFSRRRH